MKKPVATKITVKQIPEKEVPTEVLAASIVAIADGVRKLRAGRLTDKALLLLIQHAAPGGVSQRDIKAVFEGIESLERCFVKKPRP